MSYPFTLAQNAKLVEILAPAADAAGRTGTGFTLKHAHKAYLVAHITQGNAATILLTPQQCTTVAGGGAKALASAVPIWFNLDTSLTDTLVRQTDAVNFTTDAGVKNKIVVFEIDPAYLDSANGFVCIRLNTGASNAANITQVMAYLVPGRYDEVNPPSARID
jgi:hypothetical protein